MREQPERPLLRTLADALRPKHLLLLLDNCEHLVAACAAVAEGLLRACPELRIVATSREPLGIVAVDAHVVEYRLAGPIPEGHAPPAPTSPPVHQPGTSRPMHQPPTSRPIARRRRPGQGARLRRVGAA